MSEVLYGGGGGGSAGREKSQMEVEAEVKRGSFGEGVSLEAEYTFSIAVEKFARAAVKCGRFKGYYILNVKDQMRLRMLRSMEAETKVRVVTIGASELGRIRKVWEVGGTGRMELGEEIRVKGKLDRAEGVRIERELENVSTTPDKVVISGPGNSLMEHEGREGKERTVQRVVRVKLDTEGQAETLVSEYHLVEPLKLSMCERKVVAMVLAGIVRKCRELWPLVEVVYLTTLPRHVERCCPNKGHMSDLDPQVIQSSRMDLEEDIGDEIRRAGEKVQKVHWWSVYGLQMEPSLSWIKEKGVVSNDGVHMSKKSRELVAGLLYRRVTEVESETGVSKRRRMSWQ